MMMSMMLNLLYFYCYISSQILLRFMSLFITARNRTVIGLQWATSCLLCRCDREQVMWPFWLIRKHHKMIQMKFLKIHKYFVFISLRFSYCLALSYIITLSHSLTNLYTSWTLNLAIDNTSFLWPHWLEHMASLLKLTRNSHNESPFSPLTILFMCTPYRTLTMKNSSAIDSIFFLWDHITTSHTPANNSNIWTYYKYSLNSKLL